MIMSKSKPEARSLAEYLDELVEIDEALAEYAPKEVWRLTKTAFLSKALAAAGMDEKGLAEVKGRIEADPEVARAIRSLLRMLKQRIVDGHVAGPEPRVLSFYAGAVRDPVAATAITRLGVHPMTAWALAADELGEDSFGVADDIDEVAREHGRWRDRRLIVIERLRASLTLADVVIEGHPSDDERSEGWARVTLKALPGVCIAHDSWPEAAIAAWKKRPAKKEAA